MEEITIIVLLSCIQFRFLQNQIEIELIQKSDLFRVAGFPKGASSNGARRESARSQREKLHGAAAEPADRPK